MHRLVRDESGEGVISAAIAVLIMAFLGVAMWVAFKATLKGATNNVNHQVSNIGR
jgi:Flp pilus assembly pilin Flp